MGTIGLYIPFDGEPGDEAVLNAFKKEIDKFDLWMQNLKDVKYQGPLTKAERVLLLTYFMQKHSGNLDR